MSEEMNQTNGIDEEAKKGGEDEKETKEAEKKYSDADLNEIINQKFAKWQEKQDKAVADTAEETKANVEKFVEIVNAQVKANEVRRATGTTPKSYTGSEPMTEIQKRIAKYHK